VPSSFETLWRISKEESTYFFPITEIFFCQILGGFGILCFMEEKLILVDENDREVGEAEKMEAHKAGKLHRSFSIFIFNSQGEMLLQRRAAGKYHSGGLWTNACCGHPRPGEGIMQAARRRLKEEMGFDCELVEIFQFTYRVKLDHDLLEYELDHAFAGTYDGKVSPDPNEASDFAWVERSALLEDVKVHPDSYTKWFKITLERAFQSLAIQGREG